MKLEIDKLGTLESTISGRIDESFQGKKKFLGIKYAPCK
jgi:hypothetical protein